MGNFKSGLDHVAIYVADIKEKIRLLEQTFGMTVTLIDGDAENPEQVWFDGGIQLISRPEEPDCTLAHIALTTDSLYDTAKSLGSFGARVLPKGDKWIEFPDSLVVELMEEKEET